MPGGTWPVKREWACLKWRSSALMRGCIARGWKGGSAGFPVCFFLIGGLCGNGNMRSGSARLWCWIPPRCRRARRWRPFVAPRGLWRLGGRVGTETCAPVGILFPYTHWESSNRTDTDSNAKTRFISAVGIRALGLTARLRAASGRSSRLGRVSAYAAFRAIQVFQT